MDVAFCAAKFQTVWFAKEAPLVEVKHTCNRSFTLSTGATTVLDIAAEAPPTARSMANFPTSRGSRRRAGRDILDTMDEKRLLTKKKVVESEGWPESKSKKHWSTTKQHWSICNSYRMSRRRKEQNWSKYCRINLSTEEVQKSNSFLLSITSFQRVHNG